MGGRGHNIVDVKSYDYYDLKCLLFDQFSFK